MNDIEMRAKALDVAQITKQGFPPEHVLAAAEQYLRFLQNRPKDAPPIPPGMRGPTQTPPIPPEMRSGPTQVVIKDRRGGGVGSGGIYLFDLDDVAAGLGQAGYHVKRDSWCKS